nr:MAG TPA: hypothetical protein [Caudoviricetes sp.]
MLNVDFLLGERNYIRNEFAIFCLFRGNFDVEHHFHLLNHIEEIDRLQFYLVSDIRGRGNFVFYPFSFHAVHDGNNARCYFFFFHNYTFDMIIDELVPPKPKALQRI